MRKIHIPLSIRSVVLFILFLGTTLLVLTRFANLQQLVTRLIHGSPVWIGVGILIHVFYFYCYAVIYYFSFRMVGVRLSTLGLLPALLASLFVNAVLPTGGVGGAAVMVNYAAGRGCSGSRAMVAVLLTLVVDLLTLIPFIAYGIFFLAMQHQLHFYEGLGFLFYMIFIVGLTTLLVLARKKQAWVRGVLSWFRHLVNRIGKRHKRPDLIKEEWVKENAQEFIDGSVLIARDPRYTIITLVWCFFTHIVNLGGLYAFFLAYHQPVGLGTVDAAFSLGIVFFIISVIPQGVGAVEGIMGLIMVNVGIPKTNAAVIALAFRGVDFWLPVVAGFISYHFVSRKVNLHKTTSQEPGNMMDKSKGSVQVGDQE